MGRRKEEKKNEDKEEEDEEKNDEKEEEKSKMTTSNTTIVEVWVKEKYPKRIKPRHLSTIKICWQLQIDFTIHWWNLTITILLTNLLNNL